ncbi:MAG TPA: helix-turn-helix domain-containing protein, partial [Rugosimonospora sp.]|nr:helix-turn-helix domain-containing protein [Rugosimonospora sp.]
AVGSFTDEVVALLGVPADGDLPRLVTELHKRVRGDARLGRTPFSVGASRVAAGPELLPTAYEQARTAVHIGRRLQGSGARASFDQLGVHRLLSLIPDQAELRGFAAEVLGELAGETPEARDLRHTLAVLLDTNCNVAQAARELHFHYNTMRYRIYKLEKILGPFTSTAARRLDVAVALRVLELRER